MRSVADRLREEIRTRVEALSPQARIALAFDLGDADVSAYMRANGASSAEAVRAFARARAAGRQRSCANDVDVP